MKTNCLALVGVLAFVIAPSATAHRLVPDDGTHTTPETSICINDADLSQVVYHTVTAESNQLWLSFDAVAGQKLYWQLGIPAIPGLEEYRPTVVLLGPGLPELNLPFPIPAGLGGVVLDSTGLPGKLFKERFTGTCDWIVHEEERVLEESGRYYLVGYHPEMTQGKFWLAIGRREVFGLQDILEYEDVLTFVRQYHEVEDERLPILPCVLLLVSRIAQFFVGHFG